MARRTKTAETTGDEGGLSVFHADVALASFPGLPFLKAIEANKAKGAKRAKRAPPSLEALYKPEDERKLVAHKAKVRAILSRFDPDAPKPPGKRLLDLGIGLRVRAYLDSAVRGPFDGAHDC